MKKYLILITLVLASVIYFVTSQKDQQEPMAQKPTKPNVVSQVEPEPVEQPVFDNNQWQKEHDELIDIFKQSWLAFLVGRQVKPINTNPSYLEAYRDHRYYENCISIIGNILSEQDPFKYTIPNGLSIDALPVVQQQALEKRLDKCLELTHFEINYIAERAHINLKTRLSKIKPKTEIEVRLAALTAQIQDFEILSNQLERAQRGDNIDDMLFLELHKQKNKLIQQMPSQLSFFGGYQESDQASVDHFNQLIAAIEQKIEDNKFYDKEKIEGFRSQQATLLQEIEFELLDTPSSDAVLAIFDLFNQEINQAVVKQSKKIFTGGIELIPLRYEQYLLPVIANLRACELNHPCEPQSQLMEKICLDFGNSNAEYACESELLDYYLHHYLSPNQLLDVENILAQWN